MQLNWKGARLLQTISLHGEPPSDWDGRRKESFYFLCMWECVCEYWLCGAFDAVLHKLFITFFIHCLCLSVHRFVQGGGSSLVRALSGLAEDQGSVFWTFDEFVTAWHSSFGRSNVLFCHGKTPGIVLTCTNKLNLLTKWWYNVSKLRPVWLNTFCS